MQIYDVRRSLPEPEPSTSGQLSRPVHRGVLVSDEFVPTSSQIVKAVKRSDPSDGSVSLLAIMNLVRPYIEKFLDVAHVGVTCRALHVWYMDFLRGILESAAGVGVDPTSVTQHYRSLQDIVAKSSGLSFERVELGAGPLLSAVALWDELANTAFTEFRDLRTLILNYGMLVCSNFLFLGRHGNPKHNAVLLGVDATNLARSMFKSKILQFTNPNIGNPDVTEHINHLIGFARLHPGEMICVRSGQQFFGIDLGRLPGDWQLILDGQNKKHARKIYGIFKQTAFVIAVCRNINLLSRFFDNALKALNEDGVIELIVEKEYLERWHLEELAIQFGWQLSIREVCKLPFTHMQTQKSRQVNRTQPEHLRLTFTFVGGSGLIQQIYEQIFTGQHSAHLVVSVGLVQPGLDTLIMGDIWD